MAKKKVKSNEVEQVETENRAVEIAKKLNAAKKDYGSLQVMTEPVEKVPTISTGVLPLDLISTGYPYGRVVEVYGPNSSGKTTLMLHGVASVQALGGIGAYIDAEHALDLSYAEKLGVDMNKLMFAQPDSGERVFDLMVDLAQHLKHGDIMVMDSVDALVTQSEIDGELTENEQPGQRAKLMSRGLRKLVPQIASRGIIVLFVNQVRNTIGGSSWGPNETTSGGNGLRFYASQRIEIKRVGSVKNGDDVVGNKTRIKVVKNKIAAPFREVDVELIFGEGISPSYNILELAQQIGVAQKSGSWYSFGDQRLGQGQHNSCDFLKENPVILTEMRDKVLEAYGWGV